VIIFDPLVRYPHRKEYQQQMAANEKDRTPYQPKTKLNHGILFKWIDSLTIKPHLKNFLRTVAGFWSPGKTPFPSNLTLASAMELTKRRVVQIKAELRKLNIPFFKMVNTKTADKRKNNPTRYEFDEHGIWSWYRNEKNPIDDHGYKAEKLDTEMEKGTEMESDSGLYAQTGMVERETEGVPKPASVPYRSGLRSKNTLKKNNISNNFIENKKHNAKTLDPLAGSGTRSRDSSPPTANTFRGEDNQGTGMEHLEEELEKKGSQQGRIDFERYKRKCSGCEYYSIGYCLRFVEIIRNYDKAKLQSMLENGCNCPIGKWQVDEQESAQRR